MRLTSWLRYLSRSQLLLLCLLLPAAGSTAAATTASAAEHLDQLFKAGMLKLLDVEQWPCLYSGRFEQQRRLKGSSLKLASSGQFLYSCEQGLLWEIEKPIAESLVYTYAALHFQVRAGSSKPLKGPIQTRMAKLLLSLLGGNAATLAEDFTVQRPESDPDQLILQPQSKALQQHFLAIRLLNDAQTVAVSIEASNSGVTELLISELTVRKLPPVVVCAAFSLHPQQACRRLFNSATD